MRILFVGDIMGRAGREALQTHLPSLKNRLEVDVAIVNGENAAHGRGITEKFAQEFFSWGVDCITTGNHVWDQREVITYIARESRLLRPINFPPGTPGKGFYVLELRDGRKIVIINIMGRLFMDPLDDPFQVMSQTLEKVGLNKGQNAVFVDFHGEATSEKLGFAHHFDGQVSAVIGTHTHIPTADHHVLPKGTAYMSDAGMTGDYDSVIGVRKDIAIQRFLKKMPGENIIPASENSMLCGALVITDDRTGLARSIQPIRIGAVLSQVLPD